MNERVDLVVIAPRDRLSFQEELAGRSTHARVRVVVLGEGDVRVGANETCLATVPVAGAERVDVAHAAAAALTGVRVDPSLVRAPGRPRPI
ncbi:MAG: hypothetical protein EXR61_01860 [Chloroflexi bacterium]|nr:hypothetical protein [Chloroflexota bacterium]